MLTLKNKFDVMTETYRSVELDSIGAPIRFICAYGDVLLLLFYWNGKKLFECLYWKDEELQDRQVDTLDAIRLIAQFQWLVPWDTLTWMRVA